MVNKTVNKRLALMAACRRQNVAAAAAAVVAFAVVAPALAVETVENELCERLLETANSFADAPEGVPVARPLADAATRLLVDDPRLLRKLVDLRLRLGDRDGAIAAIDRLRKANPADELAQVQAIDLYIDKMQSADAKQQYLSRVVDVESVSSAVRSHAAVVLSNVLSELGREGDASAAVDKSLKLNSANPRARQLKVDEVFRSQSSATDRAKAVVSLLLVNPMQPGSIAVLAEELARAGATDEAMNFYRQSFETSRAIGFPPAVTDAVHYSALLLANGRAKEAQSMAALATEVDPRSPEAWYMTVLAAADDGDATAKATTAARAALVRNLVELHQIVTAPAAPHSETTGATPGSEASDGSDTTAGSSEQAKPNFSRIPEVRTAADTLAKGSNTRLKNAYLRALADLAWFDACFTKDAPDKEVLTAVATLAGDQSPTVARIDGFAALSAGQLDQARVKLSAIADGDAIAAAGLLAIKLKQTNDPATVINEANELIARLPVGVWAGVVRRVLPGVTLTVPTTAETSQVVAEAKKLSPEWLDFTKNQRKFYVILLSPVKVATKTGEPMLLKLTLQNVGDLPLAIGPGGVIDGVAYIDASVRGGGEQSFPAVASVRLSEKLVLAPRQSITTPVRIDNANLTAFVDARPAVATTVFPSVVINARATDTGIAPGPGGLREQAESVVDRPSAALANDAVRADLTKQLADSDPVNRLRAIQTVSANLNALLNSESVTAEQQKLVDIGTRMLEKAVAEEKSPVVAAVTQRLLINLRTTDAKSKALNEMLSSPAWESKALAILSLAGQPASERQAVLKPLTSADDDKVIQTLATAVMKLPDRFGQDDRAGAANESK